MIAGMKEAREVTLGGEVTALQKLVTYAYDQVAYYHDLFDKLGIRPEEISTAEDLTRIPVSTKDMMQQNISDFVAKEYQRYPKSQRVDVKRTSGSTGKYMKIYWDRHDDIRSLYPLWKARYSQYGIEPRNKFCTSFTTYYMGNKIVEHQKELIINSGKTLAFNKVGLSRERMREIYQKILAFDPEWFYFQPSVALLLSHMVREENLPKPARLRYIELTGELVTQRAREDIREAFGIDPTDMYGTNETNGIAFECREHHHHVLSGNAIVEVLKNGLPVIGEEGDVYVTCLNNFAMPFIRYETGDRGTLINSDCPCGNKNPILILHSGRTSDLIELKDGEQISSYVLVSIIEYTNELMEGVIKQYQFVQTGIGEFDVTIALKPAYIHWDEAVKESFLENIKDPRLHGAKWHFHFVDTIYPDEKTGKLKDFIPMKK